MIKGLGNDIIEIGRIEGSIGRFGQRFLDRLFTPDEQKYCTQYHEPARHFAGRFAAKEAIVKALGTGFRHGISWLDIEIINDNDGCPHVYFSQSLKDLFDNPRILISISHCKDYASAVAIWIA